jgi:hypothetical protein
VEKTDLTLQNYAGKRVGMQNLRVFVVILVLGFEFLTVSKDDDDWAAEEEIFRHPRHSLVRLKALW